MVQLAELPETERRVLHALECVPFDTQPWTPAAPPGERRVTLVSSAGLMMRGERPVPAGDNRYRTIAHGARAGDVLMSHVSVNFDRSGFVRDENVVLPRARLGELADDGTIACASASHYSFMGATAPQAMERNARKLAGELRAEGVNTALLVPV